jgi:hypothetical protein
MTVLTGIDQIRKQPAFYIGDYQPTGQFLAGGLAHCALICGARHLQIDLLDNGWVCVSAEHDWITSSLPDRCADWPLQRVALSLVPLIGGRQNEIRFEVIAAAFSDHFALKSGNEWLAALGDIPPEAVRSHLSDARFAVVFEPRCQRVFPG